MAPAIMLNIEEEDNAITEGSLERYLVSELTKIMLEKICGNLGDATNAHLIDRWQHDVTKVLSLSNKITRAKSLPGLHLLRIVNDLVATKAISLDNIREIVQLGLKSSKKQEILSEKFVNTVLEKLDKLEQNEKNLIPRRSFVMRCLALIPIESDVRLSLYKKLFSNEPFPLMSAIIERIFVAEDDENEDIFLTIITNVKEALRRSARLNTINKCFKDLDTNMATLCCDVIGQILLNNYQLNDLVKLEPYTGRALEALYVKEAPALQKITAISLLKEFVRRFWDSFLQEDKNRPIAYNRMQEGDFDSDELINQINNSMNFAHPLIHSFKIYFLRNLRQRDFSIDDVRQFCGAQKKFLPWLGTLNWEDISENRLPFNPYCSLPEYSDAERGFTTYYSISNKAPFQTFVQNIKQKDTLTARLSLMGLFFVRLHALRASREWQHAEIQSFEFLTKELSGMNNLPVLFKTIATRILSNKFPLLQIDSKISNEDLCLKSVMAHIIAYHASMGSNSSQLAMYLHRLQDCQNMFILACSSDSESLVLNAVAASEGVTRYSCKCGMKYVIANYGGAVTTGVCPNCKNTIGGTSYKPAAGNVRIDNQQTSQIATNDQAGYIGEAINQTLAYCVRSLPPTSYRILHLIVHVLIGASAPQPALTFLRKNNSTATDAEKYCMFHIQNDWKILKNLLNCGYEVYFIKKNFCLFFFF